MDKKTIKIVFEFEADNATEKRALRDLIGTNIVSAILRFKNEEKTVEDAINFFQKISDLSNIEDLLN